MGQISNIQWCDGTVNAVMGCDGCELLGSAEKVASLLSAEVVKNIPGSAGGEVRSKIQTVLQDQTTTQIFAARENLVDQIVTATGCSESLRDGLISLIGGQVICYAAKLHANRGGKIKGYAAVFERPEVFPGRIGAAAKWKDLSGTDRLEKPWLNGCRRLIFLSDMGDALSKGISFDTLRSEIIENVCSEQGSRHFWLWLTKRPSRMAQLAGRLDQWPANVVAMTSITSARTVPRIAELLKVPAAVRGLSVEPLWERLTLPLDGISWVIVGGQSGPNAKPFDLAWARDLRDQCRAAGVAFFVKQLGSNPIENGVRLKLEDRHGGDWNEWPADLRIREVPGEFKTLNSGRERNKSQLSIGIAGFGNPKEQPLNKTPVTTPPGWLIEMAKAHYGAIYGNLEDSHRDAADRIVKSWGELNLAIARTLLILQNNSKESTDEIFEEVDSAELVDVAEKAAQVAGLGSEFKAEFALCRFVFGEHENNAQEWHRHPESRLWRSTQITELMDRAAGAIEAAVGRHCAVPGR